MNYCLDLAEHAAHQIESSEHLELAGEPSLSVVLFRRRGWRAADYTAWSRAARTAGVLITPTCSSDGAPALRLCFVNPVLAKEQLDAILAGLDAAGES